MTEEILALIVASVLAVLAITYGIHCIRWANDVIKLSEEMRRMEDEQDTVDGGDGDA